MSGYTFSGPATLAPYHANQKMKSTYDAPVYPGNDPTVKILPPADPAVRNEQIPYTAQEIVDEALDPYGQSRINTRTGSEYSRGTSHILTQVTEEMFNQSYDVLLNEVATIEAVDSPNFSWIIFRFDNPKLDRVPELTSGRRNNYTYEGHSGSVDMWGSSQVMEHNALCEEGGRWIMIRQCQQHNIAKRNTMCKDVIQNLKECKLHSNQRRILTQKYKGASIHDICLRSNCMWDILKQQEDGFSDIYNGFNEDGNQFNVKYNMVLGSPAIKLCNVTGSERLDYDKAGDVGPVRRNTMASDLFNLPFGVRFAAIHQYEEAENGFMRDVFISRVMIGEMWQIGDTEDCDFNKYTSRVRDIMIYSETVDNMVHIGQDKLLQNNRRFDTDGFPITFHKKNDWGDFSYDQVLMDPFLFSPSQGVIRPVKYFGQIKPSQFNAGDIVNLSKTMLNSMQNESLKTALVDSFEQIEHIVTATDNINTDQYVNFLENLSSSVRSMLGGDNKVENPCQAGQIIRAFFKLPDVNRVARENTGAPATRSRGGRPAALPQVDTSTTRSDGPSSGKRAATADSQPEVDSDESTMLSATSGFTFSGTSTFEWFPGYQTWAGFNKVLEEIDLGMLTMNTLNDRYPEIAKNVSVVRNFVSLFKTFIYHLRRAFPDCVLLSTLSAGAHTDPKHTSSEEVAFENLIAPGHVPIFYPYRNPTQAEVGDDESSLPSIFRQINQLQTDTNRSAWKADNVNLDKAITESCPKVVRDALQGTIDGDQLSQTYGNRRIGQLRKLLQKKVIILAAQNTTDEKKLASRINPLNKLLYEVETHGYKNSSEMRKALKDFEITKPTINLLEKIESTDVQNIILPTDNITSFARVNVVASPNIVQKLAGKTRQSIRVANPNNFFEIASSIRGTYKAPLLQIGQGFGTQSSQQLLSLMASQGGQPDSDDDSSDSEDDDDDNDELSPRSAVSSTRRSHDHNRMDLLSAVSQPDFQKLLQDTMERETASIAMKAMIKIYMTTKLTKRQLESMHMNNIMIPFGHLLVRPHMEYLMHDLYALRDKGEAIRVFEYKKQNKTEISHDGLNRQTWLSCVFMFRSAVIREDFIYPQRNVLVAGMIGGTGHKFYSEQNYKPSEMAVPTEESLLSILVPYRCEIDTIVDLTGTFQAPRLGAHEAPAVPPQHIKENASGRLSYPTAHFYSTLHRFSAVGNYEEEVAPTGIFTESVNTLCRRALTLYYNQKEEKWNNLMSGTGHWKDHATHAGCAKGRRGATFKRYDETYWPGLRMNLASSVIC